jgi:hypothetical protein
MDALLTKICQLLTPKFEQFAFFFSIHSIPSCNPEVFEAISGNPAEKHRNKETAGLNSQIRLQHRS